MKLKMLNKMLNTKFKILKILNFFILGFLQNNVKISSNPIRLTTKLNALIISNIKLKNNISFMIIGSISILIQAENKIAFKTNKLIDQISL